MNASLITTNTSTTRGTTYNPEQELARYICKYTAAPVQLLRLIFRRTMQKLESQYPSKYSVHLKQKIWREYLKADFEKIEKRTILEFRDQLSRNFQENQIDQMIEEYRRVTACPGTSFSARLQEIFALVKTVINKVAEKNYTEDILTKVIVKAIET